MMTLPDFNEAIKPLNGSLFPFGWIKLLRWLHKPKCRTMRVPLMGVVQKLQASDAVEPCSTRSEEHTSELQSLMRISYAVFCLKKKNHKTKTNCRNDSTQDTTIQQQRDYNR